jgi:ribosome-binding protein aMBF1 (putative translation factor)
MKTKEEDFMKQYNISEEEIDFQVFHNQLCHGIAEAIKSKGWTYEYFAKKMDINKSLVPKWLGGVHLLGEETLYKIQKVLGINIFDVNFLKEK